MSDRPDEVAGEAARYEFRVERGRLISGLVIAGILFIGGLGIFPLALYYDFPEPVLNKRVILILFGTIWVSLCLALFVNNARNLGQRVLVDADGLVLRKPGSRTECQWDEIAFLWLDSATLGGPALARTNLTIQTTDGSKVLLSEFFVGMNELVAIVLKETAERLVPVVHSQIEDGKRVMFGDLGIDSDGLTQGEQTLVWSQAGVIEASRGRIQIRRKGDSGTWYLVRVKDMPNYHVFLAVAEELLGERNPDESPNDEAKRGI